MAILDDIRGTGSNHANHVDGTEVVFDGERKDALIAEIAALASKPLSFGPVWAKNLLPRIEKALTIRCVVSPHCHPEAFTRFGGRDWFVTF